MDTLQKHDLVTMEWEIQPNVRPVALEAREIIALRGVRNDEQKLEFDQSDERDTFNSVGG